LLLREPFFAHLLGSVNKEVVGPEHEVQSLAVGAGKNSLTLYVNADFWDKHLNKPALRYGLLKHEMLHLVFRHLLTNEPQLNAMLLNVAFDLVVNQYIQRDQLPEDSIFLESFPELNLQKGQTWFYYYQKIAELYKQSGGSDGEGSPGMDFLQNISPESNGLDRHQPWQKMRQRTELEQAVTDTQMDSMLRLAQQRTGTQAWGSMPGEIQEAIGNAPSTVQELSWRAILRLFVGNASKTRLKNTIKRVSKRYGTTPGVKIRRQHRLMVAVDTSGSISQSDLDLFFKEIYLLWRAGAVFDIVECDTKIGRRYPYKGNNPRSAYGRGGTDFNPPLELANLEQPDGLIYFTDGYAYTPTIRSRVPVLWILTKNGMNTTDDVVKKLPGRKIKLST
jgi:predicted metal-dependent peptidase